VLLPLAAFLLVKTLPLAAGVTAALLVLALSAAPPLLPRKLQRFVSNAYVFSLVITPLAVRHLFVAVTVKAMAGLYLFPAVSHLNDSIRDQPQGSSHNNPPQLGPLQPP
jgi:hypothetical protein